MSIKDKFDTFIAGMIPGGESLVRHLPADVMSIILEEVKEAEKEYIEDCYFFCKRARNHGYTGGEIACADGDLKYVIDIYTYFPDEFGPECIIYAIRRGQLHIVKWLHENKLTILTDPRPALAAVKDQEILTWLCENGYKMPE